MPGNLFKRSSVHASISTRYKTLESEHSDLSFNLLQVKHSYFWKHISIMLSYLEYVIFNSILATEDCRLLHKIISHTHVSSVYTIILCYVANSFHVKYIRWRAHSVVLLEILQPNLTLLQCYRIICLISHMPMKFVQSLMNRIYMMTRALDESIRIKHGPTSTRHHTWHMMWDDCIIMMIWCNFIIAV